MMNVFLHICFMCFMCYVIVTSLDAMECDVVYHLFVISFIWTASEMTFATVHLDILSTSSFLIVWGLTCRD